MQLEHISPLDVFINNNKKIQTQFKMITTTKNLVTHLPSKTLSQPRATSCFPTLGSIHYSF